MVEELALQSIVDGKLAWSRESDLLRLGHTAETLAALAGDGWLIRWDCDFDGQPLLYDSWTLTQLGAWRLGVTLHEGPDERPQWKAGPQSGPIRMPRTPGQRRLPLPELVPEQPRRELVRDDDGDPLTILGRPVVVDPRLERKKRRSKRRSGLAAYLWRAHSAE